MDTCHEVAWQLPGLVALVVHSAAKGKHAALVGMHAHAGAGAWMGELGECKGGVRACSVVLNWLELIWGLRVAAGIVCMEKGSWPESYTTGVLQS